jgi:hypothetical protein
MSTLLSSIDHNQETPVGLSSTMTETNHHEVRCAMCARELYVDEQNYERYVQALTSSLDNPFRCEVCNEEFDDRE